MNTSTIKLIICISSLFAASSAMASQKSQQYTVSDNSVESKLCLSAAVASKASMDRKVAALSPTRNTNSEYGIVANKLLCNNMPIAEFARQAGNIKVAEKLSNYQKRRVIIKEIALNNGNGADLSEQGE